jgi:methyl-accepting chemotaxis protein
MKLKFRLSIIVIALITAIVAISSVVILSRSSAMITQLAYLDAEETAKSNSYDVARRIGVYVTVAKTIAQYFGEYQTIAEANRRASNDDMLYSIFNQNPNYYSLWTAWNPNVIDSYDATLGRYITAYTRASGKVEKLPSGYQGWETMLNDTLAGKANAKIAQPVWINVNGAETPVITITYKIYDSQTKRAVGIVGITYLTALQQITDDIGKELYDGAGFAGIYANNGMTVAHFDKTRVKNLMQNNQAERALLGDSLNDVLNAIKNGGTDDEGTPLSLNKYSATMGTDVHLIYFPINIADTDEPWSLVVAIPMNAVLAGVKSLTEFVIVFAIIAIILAAVITFVIIVQVVKPILGMSFTLKDISEGEGDLTVKIAEKGNDEISDMAHYFNQTMEKIRQLIVVIKRNAGVLEGIGTELASNMTETAAAINQITANIQSIKQRVINQSASVTETNATMEQITININRLNDHVENQSNNVSQASSAIEEMVANIASVTQTLVKNGGNVKELIEASDVGRAGLQDVATDIQEIARESEGLLEINSVMENIASQTNLLSMNAAIEAAHAGEAGKGFAVVADEIRKLAESSSEQSKTIGMVLKKIKASIDKITTSTDNVLQRFEAIDSGVKIVAEQEDNVRNAMEEQGEGSKQVLQSITNVNTITRNVKSGSEEMLEGSTEVIKESKNLERVTQEITGGMNEMAAGADQINIAVTRVNEISEKNKDSIDSLVKEVSRFKVE